MPPAQLPLATPRLAIAAQETAMKARRLVLILAVLTGLTAPPIPRLTNQKAVTSGLKR